MKILHISDLHIRLNERHDEYYDILSQLDGFTDIDYTVFTGDMFHDKSKLSPEAIKLASWFITKLSQISRKKVIIIPGNHDKNEKNNNRLDAISPIVMALGLENVILSICSEQIYTEDFIFVNYSIFDQDYVESVWRSGPDDKRKIIGLFHGALNNVSTDTGHILNEKNSIDFSICDLLLLGDIHKRQVVDIYVEAAYAGSMIQQNFGESEGKGGIIWEFKSNNFHRKYFDLNNPYLFKSIKLSEYEKVVSSLKKTYKLKIVNDTGDLNKFIQTKKELENSGFEIRSLQDDSILKSHKLDLTSIKTLDGINKIIKEKFKNEYDIYKEDLIDLNSKYYNTVKNSDISSGVWKIKELKWDNLFKFGSNNSINFDNYKNSILLISGPNYSGKTSTIDIITFAIFGSWTKEPAKYSDYVNQNKNNAYSYIEIEKDGKRFSIERKLVLTNKTFKNSVKFVNITNNNELLNGDDINETEKLIQKYFGTLDSFLLTTLITQSDGFGFIKEKSTKRKEILNQFLSIDFFKSIDNLVSSDLAVAKALYDSNQKQVDEYKIDDIDIENLKKLNFEFNERLNNKYYDITEQKNIIKIYEDNLKNYSIFNEINLLNQQENEYIEEYLKLETQISDIKKKIKTVIADIKKDYNLFSLFNLKNEINKQNSIISKNIIEKVPCDFVFTECKFLENSIKNKNIIKENSEKLLQINKELENFNIDQYNSLLELEKTLNNELSYLDKYCQKLNEKITKIQYKSKQLKPNISSHNVSEDDYLKCKKQCEDILKQYSNDFSENQIVLFQINQYEKSLQKLSELNKESSKLLYNFSLLKTYSDIVGKNGLPLYLINYYIETISDIVSDIVSTILDKDVKLEINESKFNIYLKNKDEDKYRIIESASGSETFFIGLAIRLAFYKISNLVKSDLLIMDEPATSLDHLHQEKFGEFFNTLNQYFGNVLIVTHLDLLKQYTEKVVLIENRDGYAKLI